MALEPGLRIGRLRVGNARPAPAGFSVFAVEGDEALELVAPNGHLRLRAGAKAAWTEARARRVAAAAVSVPEHAWIEVDGWPVWVRPRSESISFDTLDERARASLAGWLQAGGVDLARATEADLVANVEGAVRYAPLGLAENQLDREPPATLATLLGPPGAPAEARVAVTRAAPAPGRLVQSLGLARDLVLPDTPSLLVVVALPRGDAGALARVASRTATDLREVERAAERGASWVWAVVTDPGQAPRLRGQAERAGLRAELVGTLAPSPAFLTPMVLAGVAQVPFFLTTGIAALDFAIIGGLGVTSVASAVRAFARIAPARRAAAGAGAWESWRRSTRTTGAARRLLALELRLAAEVPSGPVRVDLGEAVDAAWTRLFAALADPRGLAAVDARLALAAEAVDAELAHPDAVSFGAALRKLSSG